MKLQGWEASNKSANHFKDERSDFPKVQFWHKRLISWAHYPDKP